MRAREVSLRVGEVVGAVIGYGGLSVFLSLVGFQAYRWFRDGEWTHIGVCDGLRMLLSHWGVAPDSTGRLSALSHWVDAPVEWLGLHRVLEVLPASLALFAISILGNGIFIYMSDRIRVCRAGGTD
jgi:hypothetical protein